MSTVIRASESNHWYTRDGVPQYTVEAKKGGLRATTLRDARTMNLVPSVTTILGVAAQPALLAWMQQQVLMAALIVGLEALGSQLHCALIRTQPFCLAGDVVAGLLAAGHQLEGSSFTKNLGQPSSTPITLANVRSTS